MAGGNTIKTIFRAEQFDKKEDALERLAFLQKMESFWRLSKLPEKPKFYDGIFWIIYEEKM